MEKRPSVVDEAVGVILQRIQNQEFPVGTRLPGQTELASQMGVSRVALREAIKELQALGVVSSHHGTGTFVVKTSVPSVMPDSLRMMMNADGQALQWILEARRVIEERTAQLAALRATPEDLATMAGILERQRDVTNSVQQFAKLDLEFHLAVANASQNFLLKEFLEGIRKAYWDDVLKAFLAPGIIERAYLYHRKTYEAIQAKDMHKAGHVMVDHLYDPERMMLGKDVDLTIHEYGGLGR